MDAFVSYLVKVLLVSGILYTYYLIALRNKKFHSYNRYYLLLTIGISLILPLNNFSWYQIKESQSSQHNNILNFIHTTGMNEPPFHVNSGLLFFSLSILVSTIFCVILLLKIIWIYKMKAQHTSVKMHGFVFIETSLKQAPFSFLDNLFWKQNIGLNTINGKKIFNHELTHIKQRHSYDKLFSQIVVCIFWMNPFYWLIQKELNVIHEFIADAGSIDEGDTQSFAEMLLQAHNGGSYLSSYHSFFNSSIKRRLIMISSSKNVRYSYLRRVFVLPVIIAVVMFSSVSIVRAQNDPRLNPNDTLKIEKISLQKRNDSIAEVRVNYVDASGKAAVLNIAAKYSETDSLKGDNLNKAFIHDDETGETKEISHEQVSDIVKQVIQDPPSNEIYYVDGTECSTESVKKLDPKKIKTLNHYTKEDAVKRYGEKARNGVFVFTTK